MGIEVLTVLLEIRREKRKLLLDLEDAVGSVDRKDTGNVYKNGLNDDGNDEYARMMIDDTSGVEY